MSETVQAGGSEGNVAGIVMEESDLQWKRQLFDISMNLISCPTPLPGNFLTTQDILEKDIKMTRSEKMRSHRASLAACQDYAPVDDHHRKKERKRSKRKRPNVSDVRPQQNDIRSSTNPFLEPETKKVKLDHVLLSGTAKEQPLKSEASSSPAKCTADEIDFKRRQAMAKVHAKKMEDRNAVGRLQLKEFGIEISDLMDKSENSRFIPGLPPREFVPDPNLSDEQLKVLEAVRKGHNVFFSGSAGVGKSFLLKEICRYLQCVRREFHVTAPTGIAAINVNGMTIHSFAKFGLGDDGWEAYIKQAMNNKRIPHWLTPKVLIIDEISMMSPTLFEKIDQVARATRNNHCTAFGGIQIILSGDFFQLPPVAQAERCPKCGERKSVPCAAPPAEFAPPIYTDKPLWKRCIQAGCELVVNADARYAFETRTWVDLKVKYIALTKVFRQKEAQFIACLNRIRYGQITPEDVQLLKSCQHAGGQTDSVEVKPTRLHPQRSAVDTDNRVEFQKLDQTHLQTIDAYDVRHGPFPRSSDFGKLEHLQARSSLQLTIGCQVMLLCNLSFGRRLVNGSRGVVVDFVEGHDYMVAAESTIKGVNNDAKDNLANLQAFAAQNLDIKLPCVLFANGQTSVIIPYTWKVAIDARNYAQRTQLPLSLAWSMTIHKCQGMSLDRVVLHLDRTFEAGQAYVALSRCRTLEGLQIASLDPTKIRADPRCLHFYEVLERRRAAPSYHDIVLDDVTREYEGKLEEAIALHFEHAERIPGQEEREKQIFMETCADLYDTALLKFQQKRAYSVVLSQPVPKSRADLQTSRESALPSSPLRSSDLNCFGHGSQKTYGHHKHHPVQTIKNEQVSSNIAVAQRHVINID